MSSIRKKDVQYGDQDLLSPDEFDSKYGKERISFLVDMQVVEAFRERAKREGKKYQVLMRETLRNAIFSNPVEDLEKRMEKIESVVFKKKRA